MGEVTQLNQKENLNDKPLDEGKPEEKSKINDRRNIQDIDNNNANVGNDADAGGLVRCGYDSRVLCKFQLGKESNKEKFGCDVCLKAQTRTMVLTMSNQLGTMEKRLVNIESMMQTILVKLMGIK